MLDLAVNQARVKQGNNPAPPQVAQRGEGELGGTPNVTGGCSLGGLRAACGAGRGDAAAGRPRGLWVAGDGQRRPRGTMGPAAPRCPRGATLPAALSLTMLECG